jgi:hypothetical protein
MLAYDTTSIDFNPLNNLSNGDGYNNGLGENGFSGAGGYMGGGGGFIGDVGMPTPVPTSPGNDIKVTLTNISKFNNQMSFNVQNNVYSEGSQVLINSNTINDELYIKPSINDSFKLKNYYGLKKGMINTSINVIDVVAKPPVVTRKNIFGINISSNINLKPFGSAFNFLGLNKNETTTVTKKQIVKKPGIILTTYNENGSVQSTKDYTLPQTIELGFDLDAIDKPIIATYKRIQNVLVVTNYNNSKLNDELEIIINSKDLGTPSTLKIGNSVDITNLNNTASDLSISVKGLSSFQLNNIRWQYANKFDSNSTFNINDFNILSSDNVTTLSSNDFNSNIILLIEVQPNTSKYSSLTLSKNIIDVSIEESIFDSKTAVKLIDAEYTGTSPPTPTEAPKPFATFLGNCAWNLGNFSATLLPVGPVNKLPLSSNVPVVLPNIFDKEFFAWCIFTR